jgi:hypothetical protein
MFVDAATLTQEEKEKRILYSAGSRCRCGAGLAYFEGTHADAWECSKTLLGGFAPSPAHDEFPFSMYEIKSEGQPSANGRTTRPSGIPKTREQSRISTLGEARVKMLDRNETLFVYHAPKGDQAQRYERIRAAAKEFANTLVHNCPPSAELTLAIRAVEDAMMRANQSIAVNE